MMPLEFLAALTVHKMDAVEGGDDGRGMEGVCGLRLHKVEAVEGDDIIGHCQVAAGPKARAMVAAKREERPTGRPPSLDVHPWVP